MAFQVVSSSLSCPFCPSKSPALRTELPDAPLNSWRVHPDSRQAPSAANVAGPRGRAIPTSSAAATQANRQNSFDVYSLGGHVLNSVRSGPRPLPSSQVMSEGLRSVQQSLELERPAQDPFLSLSELHGPGLEVSLTGSKLMPD